MVKNKNTLNALDVRKNFLNFLKQILWVGLFAQPAQVNLIGCKMKSIEFKKCIDEMPRYNAIFKLIKVPEWASQYGLHIGDEFTYNNGSMECNKNQRSYSLGVSYFKFIDYRLVNKLKNN